ncbi:MAG TPA: alpha/beta hydrolase, partial [Saprospiraceae bacterium]|nr:alpha/beta hydrolase [Saprospiraceae bacterium]
MLIFNKLSLFFLSGMLLLGACGWQKKVPEVSKMDDLPYPFEMKKIDIGDDIEIAYADLGGGKETLIFIHGLGSYAPAWKKNLEDLQKDYRCIAVDLPGYGKSSKGNYEGSMRFFANSIIRLMDKLNLKNAVLAGHS